MDRSPSLAFDNELSSAVDYLNFQPNLHGMADLGSCLQELNAPMDGPMDGQCYKMEDERLCGSMDGTGWGDELELDGAGDCGDADAGDANAQSKRRRRIRNQKQQELNRLAQQRYRLRKKQRYTDLQSTVCGLTNQLDAVTILETEAVVLKRGQTELQVQLHSRDQALAAASATIGAQAIQIASQTQRLEQQTAQLEVAQSQARQAAAFLSLDPTQLSERLMAVIQSAVSAIEQPSPSSPSATPLSQEELMQRISHSLQSCCRELLCGPQGKVVSDLVAKGAPLASFSVPCC